MKFLEELIQEIGSVVVEDCPEPPNEVRDGETVIGVMDDYLRRLYAVYRRMIDDLAKECCDFHNKLAVILMKPISTLSAEEKNFANKHLVEHIHVETIIKIFWSAVSDAFHRHLCCRRDSNPRLAIHTFQRHASSR